MNKLELMTKHRALFQHLQEQVERGRKYLDTYVILAQEKIEIIHYAEDDTMPRSIFYNYSPAIWKDVREFLDIIAGQKKEKWFQRFEMIDDCIADAEEWALDLTGPDCVVLEVGVRTNLRRHEVPWSREGLVSILDYFADTCNPDVKKPAISE